MLVSTRLFERSLYIHMLAVHTTQVQRIGLWALSLCILDCYAERWTIGPSCLRRHGASSTLRLSAILSCQARSSARGSAKTSAPCARRRISPRQSLSTSPRTLKSVPTSISHRAASKSHFTALATCPWTMTLIDSPPPSSTVPCVCQWATHCTWIGADARPEGEGETYVPDSLPTACPA